MAIPRIFLPLGYGDLFRFFLNMARPCPPERAAATITEFEQSFAGRWGRSHGIAFCRARMALFHYLKVLDLPPGTGVAISALHVADFINIIRLAGYRPVVIDLEPTGYGIDLHDLAAKAASGVGVIYITHLSGHATDMGRVSEIAKACGARLVEDCSQALEARFDGRRVGTWGHAAIFSLSLLKSVCTLNGGLLLTDDDTLAQALRLRAAKATPISRGPLVAEAVKNMVLAAALARPIFSLAVLPLLRLTAAAGDRFAAYQKTNKTVDLRRQLPAVFLERYSWQQARMGLDQLESLDARENRRITLARRLRAGLRSDDAVALPALAPGSENTWWLFPVIAADPAGLKTFLADHGIDSAPMLLSALSAEPAFADLHFTAPNAEALRARTLFIPLHLGMDERDVDAIAAAIAEYQAAAGSTR